MVTVDAIVKEGSSNVSVGPDATSRLTDTCPHPARAVKTEFPVGGGHARGVTHGIRPSVRRRL